MLKKTRYTHMYMKLLPSRLMLPVSHSGQNVMKPPYSSQVASTIIQTLALGSRRAMR